MSPAPFLVPAVPFSRLTEVPRKSLEDWQGAAGSGPAPQHAVAFPSPQGWGRGCRAVLWCLPHPCQQQATPQLVSFPFPAVSLAFLCPGRLVGSFPFPAEADKVFGVLAPLSRAERRAVCKLGSSELPGAPCLPPASLL